MQKDSRVIVVMAIGFLLVFNPLIYTVAVNDNSPPASLAEPSGARGAERAAASLGEIVSGVSTTVGDSFGWNVSTIEDLNGDGLRELVVGAPGNDNAGTDAGAVYIFYSYPAIGQNDIDVTSANVSIYGGNPGDEFGWDLTNVGDFDLDGSEDLLVGAPGHNGSTGQAYIFGSTDIMNAGDPAALNINDEFLHFTGEDLGDRFGQAVAWLGNITNGPNGDDIIIGAPFAGTSGQDVLIDDLDPDYKELGNWTTFSGASQYWNQDVRFPSGTGGAGANVSIWTPTLPGAGYYAVYAWWEMWAGWAPDSPYTINFKPGGYYWVPPVGGLFTDVDLANASLGWVTIDVDQTSGLYSAMWNYLGTYEFDVGQANNVTLSDDVLNPADLVAADAVWFVDAGSLNDEGKSYIYDGTRSRPYIAYGVAMGENTYDYYGSSVGSLGARFSTQVSTLNDAVVGAPGADRAYLWYEGKLPSIYADLWELPQDDPSPLDFTSGVLNTSNTFGFGMGDDGWDWQQGTYGTLSDPAAQAACGWVADPGAGTANNPLDFDPAIRVKIGGSGLSGQGTAEGNGGNNFESAAWGIEFEVTEKMFMDLLVGSKAYLSFEYAAVDPEGTGETEEEVMIYARFDDTYLGTDQGGDGRREVAYYAPNFHTTEDYAFNYFEDDVSVLITGAGRYYIDFGVAIESWSTGGEGVEAFFDNVSLEFRKPQSHDVILNGTAGSGFGFDVEGPGDLDNDVNDRDVLVGAPYTSNGSAYIFYNSNWPAGTLLNVSDGDMDVMITGDNAGDGFGFAVASAGDVNNDNLNDIIIGAPHKDTAYGIQAGVVYLFQNDGAMDPVLIGGDADNYKGGENAWDNFGHAVGSCCDLNGDTYIDLITTAPGFSPGGKTYVLGLLGPTLQWIYPIGGEILSGDVTLQASVIDPNDDIDTNGVRFYYSVDMVNWILIDSALSPSSGQLYEVSWDTTVFDDGTYYLKANVTDLDLNLAEDLTTGITIDNQFPPTVDLINPQWDDVVQGLLTINATAVDSPQDLFGGGINNTKGMEFYYSDDNITWHLLAVDRTPTVDNIYEITWNTTDLIDGVYWIKVNITDMDNMSIEDLVRFEVDNPDVEPSVTLIYPDALVTEVSDTLTINATAFDRNDDLSPMGVSFYYSSDESNWVFIDNDPTPDLDLIYETSWDTTTVNDGYYWVKAYVNDTTSLFNESISDKFLVHNSILNAPHVTVTFPNNGEELKLNAKLEVDAYDIDVNLKSEGVRFYYSPDKTAWTYIGSKATPDTPGGDHFVYIWDTLAVPDGRYWLNVSAEDTTDLMGWDHSDEPFFVHNTQLNPPIVDVIFPSGGEILSGSVTLSATAGDMENNIDNNGVYFYHSRNKVNWTRIDNVPNGTSATSISGYNYYNLSWDTTSVEDGEYWLRASATDTHNLEGFDISDPFYIHNSQMNPPIVRVVFPNGGEVLNGTVTLEAYGFDLEDNLDDSGVIFYYSKDQSSWTQIGTSPDPTTSNTRMYELTWNTTTVPDGVYWLRVTATDITSFEGVDLSDDSFIIHNNLNNPPEVKLIYPTEGETVQGSITIQVEVNDLEDNVVEVRYYYSDDNSSWELIGTSTSPTTPGGNIYSTSWNSRDVYDDEYWLRIVVEDNDSAESEVYSGGFDVVNDNVKPTKDKKDDAFSGLWWLWILIIVIIIVLLLMIVVLRKRREKEEAVPRAPGAPTPEEARAILHEIAAPAPAEQIQPIPAGTPHPKLRKVKAVPQTLVTGYEGDLGAKVQDDLQNKLNAWRQEGYNVTRLEHLMDTDIEALFLALPEFKANVARLTELKERFNALDTTGFEEEDRSIREKINNPDLADTVEREIIELEVKIDKRGDLAKLEQEAPEGELPEDELEEPTGEPEEELDVPSPEEQPPEEIEEAVEAEEEEVPSEELEAADEEFEEELEAAEEELEEEIGESDEDLEEFLPDSSSEETESEPEPEEKE